MKPTQIKFGTDGWRGVTADDFTFGNVRRVAQGTAQYMKTRSNEPLAIVGYDCRFASEDLVGAFRLGGVSATNRRVRESLKVRSRSKRETNR